MINAARILVYLLFLIKNLKKRTNRGLARVSETLEQCKNQLKLGPYIRCGRHGFGYIDLSPSLKHDILI